MHLACISFVAGLLTWLPRTSLPLTIATKPSRNQAKPPSSQREHAKPAKPQVQISALWDLSASPLPALDRMFHGNVLGTITPASCEEVALHLFDHNLLIVNPDALCSGVSLVQVVSRLSTSLALQWRERAEIVSRRNTVNLLDTPLRKDLSSNSEAALLLREACKKVHAHLHLRPYLNPTSSDLNDSLTTSSPTTPDLPNHLTR